MIDKNNKPWLLEFNESPSFHTDSEFDKEIKYTIIKDTIKLLNIDPK